uniref:Zinc fingers and homeoboxes 3a n=1 Tax=Cynoglossus semilaevis TaxID=244447 RepID=A0A3P8VSB3_CYNSE
MASKRKSTVPCMIPSKSKHVREEIILGSLPELLPTIPEDSILSISGKESGHYSHSSSKSEGNSEIQRGGTYSCSSCRLESRDLNYFLDHMHNYHIDFRAQPTFYCLDCRVSVVRFEALALHNANAHPKIMEGLVTASLTVNTRDRVTTVEQSLFADNGDDCRESGISLTKTPIAKMNKGKGEPKKFVVSHTVEVRKIDTGKDVNPNMLTHVPELLNGALSVPGAPAMPRNTVTHVITTVSNQMFHQHTPYFSSHPFSNSNKDLPKVMIPLSSIPTYDAAMDTSSFLKTSFGKFPYPTKAELCYLTVVSEFPEEQIKLWFTAQRLKQGISWSPEEIEEARRKMFNTVDQTVQRVTSQTPKSMTRKTTTRTTTFTTAGAGAAASSQVTPGQPQEHKPETAEVSAPQLSFLPLWGNKTPQQLHMLRQVFSNIRWPSSQQYEDLSVQTGLPKSEVVRWFSDSRYSHKNGQLKWLETYQRPPTEVEEARGHGENEGGSLREPQAANNKLVEMDIRKHLEGDAGLNSGQQIVWQDSYSPLLSLMGNGGNGEPGQAKESVQPKVLEDPWSGRANDLRQSAANQPHLEQQTDANQTRY